MNIGMIDVDGHNFPNLALMKLSAWHKARGDSVEVWNGLKYYDRVYQAKVFDDTYTDDLSYCVNAGEIIKGGTGYNLDRQLPDEIEHIFPDYGLYGITGTAYGFLTRGCPRRCPWCIVSSKEGTTSHKVADLGEFWNGQKDIEIMDPNLLASAERHELLQQLIDSKARVNFNQGLDVRLLDREAAEQINNIKTKIIHFAWDSYERETLKKLEQAREWLTARSRDVRVYVLTNYNTTLGQDLGRVEVLRDIGFDPYVMIYNKPKAPKETRELQRWCNNKYIFRACTFEEYERGAR